MKIIQTVNMANNGESHRSRGPAVHKMSGLKILYFNSNSILGKIHQIRAHVAIYNPDIICITETKIGPLVDDNEILGPNYTIFRKDRKQGGGGVLIACSGLSSSFRVCKHVEGPGESIISTVQIHSHLTFQLITYYRPPGESNLDILTEMLSELDLRYPIFLVGDLNLSDIDWTSGSGVVKATSSRQRLHHSAIEIFETSNLLQFIHEPTHNRGNTLDLVLVDRVLLSDNVKYCLRSQTTI